MEGAYFLDTYALIELTFGSEQYAALGDLRGVTSTYNLMELYYALLRKGHTRAETTAIWDVWRATTVEPTDEECQEAMAYKHEHKTEQLSYADCLGYQVAQRRGLLFLTGDKAFKGRAGVRHIP